MLNSLLITLPRSVNVKIYKKIGEVGSNITLYTKKLNISFNINNKIINYSVGTHSFYCTTKKIKGVGYFLRKFIKIKQFFFFLICWKKFKIAYTGKGYRIKKYPRINVLDFTFGSCHFVKTFIPNYKLKLKKKKGVIIYYRHPYSLKKNFEDICNIRLINLYTQRGLRSSNQIVYRKPKNKAVYI